MSRLAIDLSLGAAAGAGPVEITVELDGSKVEAQAPAGTGRLCLARGDNGWTAAAAPGPGLKGPHRAGGFKDAFRHRFVFVYGTRGDDAEDFRAFNKARFDAEMFWVRGNAGIEIFPDTAFDPAKYKDRSVILYGNADTNAAWAKLLAGSPVEVRNGRARVGEKRLTADRTSRPISSGPRPESDVASVGAVAWTGSAGWVAASPGQYFISGAGFPDLILVFGARPSAPGRTACGPSAGSATTGRSSAVTSSGTRAAIDRKGRLIGAAARHKNEDAYRPLRRIQFEDKPVFADSKPEAPLELPLESAHILMPERILKRFELF